MQSIARDESVLQIRFFVGPVKRSGFEFKSVCIRALGDTISSVAGYLFAHTCNVSHLEILAEPSIGHGGP